MSTNACSLLTVSVVVCLIHLAPVVSQCTTKHCHDGDNDVSALTVMVHRLQDTVERQQDSLEQQQKQMSTLKEIVEQQQKQLRRQDEMLRELKTSIPSAADCAELLKKGYSANGLYNIHVSGKNETIQVYCDMTTDDGGWLVFQRRVDNTTDFYRDWKSYKEGFGELIGNFWLGNDYLHVITAQKNYSLRVDLADFEGGTRYAVYTYFAVANKGDKYRLSLGEYSGTAVKSVTKM